MESAALKLFKKSDKENKGFIVKRDMQRMKDEIMLSSEQLEIVFDTLDKNKNGYLTLDQFLKGFREYLIITSSDDSVLRDYSEDPVIKNDFNDELTNTINLIKETNVLKTSADELEYISEQIKDENFQLPQWEIFLKDLNQDLQTYKNAHSKLEQLMKQKDLHHQSYVRKIFEELEIQFKDEKKKDECNEQMQKRIKNEIKLLQLELLHKDELLQQMTLQYEDLKIQMQQLQKKEEASSLLNESLKNQQVKLIKKISRTIVMDRFQNYYEAELEAERMKREHIENLLKNVRRRFSLEKSQCFKEGFDLARRVVHIQEEGLLQQFQMLQDMQRVLESSSDDR